MSRFFRQKYETKPTSSTIHFRKDYSLPFSLAISPDPSECSNDELVNPFLSLYQFPQVAFYGGEFLLADLIAVIHVSPHLFGRVTLPLSVREALPTAQNPPDIFVVISDISELVSRTGPTAGLIHQAWKWPHLSVARNLDGLVMAQQSVLMGLFTTLGTPAECGIANPATECGAHGERSLAYRLLFWKGCTCLPMAVTQSHRMGPHLDRHDGAPSSARPRQPPVRAQCLPQQLPLGD